MDMASFLSYAVGIILRWPAIDRVVVNINESKEGRIKVYLLNGETCGAAITMDALSRTGDPWMLLRDLRRHVFTAAGVTED